MTDASRKRRASATTTSLTAPARAAFTKKTPSPAAATAPTTDDVVLVHSASDDGAFRVLRKRGDELHVGEMRPLEDGKALTPGGEVVTLRARADSPRLFDAQTLYRVPGEAPATSGQNDASAGAPSGIPAEEPSTVGGGPAQVSTPAYREGWGAIFGSGRRRRGPHTLN